MDLVWDDITVVLGGSNLEHVRGRISLVSGEHDIGLDNETVTVVTKAKTTERKRHPQFFIRLSEGKLKYDVALLELETPIDFEQRNVSHIRYG